eukprot:g875.t1
MPGHLIRRLQQIAVAVFQKEIGGTGIDVTPVQFAALVQIRQNPGLDQATLAGLIAYDRTTIGGVVDRLEHKGFLLRKTSAADRRAKTLHLTDAGQSALETLFPAVERAQAVMLGGLSRPETETFLQLLKKATNSLNDLSRAPLKSPH